MWTPGVYWTHWPVPLSSEVLFVASCGGYQLVGSQITIPESRNLILRLISNRQQHLVNASSAQGSVLEKSEQGLEKENTTRNLK